MRALASLAQRLRRLEVSQGTDPDRDAAEDLARRTVLACIPLPRKRRMVAALEAGATDAEVWAIAVEGEPPEVVARWERALRLEASPWVA